MHALARLAKLKRIMDRRCQWFAVRLFARFPMFARDLFRQWHMVTGVQVA